MKQRGLDHLGNFTVFAAMFLLLSAAMDMVTGELDQFVFPQAQTIVYGASIAALIVLGLVDRRRKRLPRTSQTTDAVVGWVFFVLAGVGAWSLGELRPTTPREGVFALIGLVIGHWGAVRFTRKVDWGGLMGGLALVVAMMILGAAQGDPDRVVLGFAFVVFARLIQGREWALFQARGREAVVRRLSHALRTPAAAIRSLSDALATGAVEDPAERAKFLSLIQAEADRLGMGLDRMLRIARGEMSLAMSVVPIDLVEWAHLVAMRWRTRMPGLQLSVGAPLVVAADPDHLDEAIDALLDNALRYGGPDVRLAVSRTQAHAEITVEDNGRGPMLAIRDLLEQPLSIHPPTLGDNARGFGLGQWAARQVAEAHGGTLRLAGTSSFVLSLPATAALPVRL
ncbi:MAG: sensor histidine kinase [Kofleriaceae bacterium]